MRKIRSNLNLVLGRGVVALALLSIALPGCKKKQEPPPAPVQITPLPKKPVQGNMSAVKSAKVSPAGTTTATTAVSPGQVKPGAVPGGPGPVPAKPDVAVAKTSAGKPEVQKQVSTARIPQPSAAISLDFTKRRDPFRPYVQAPTPQTIPGKFAKPVKDLLPIQSFDTERFRVSGIIAGIRENSALVIDPNGKGYIVKAGMLIGSNDGRIKRITASTVEVEENYREDSGKVRKRLVKLALTRKK